MEASKCPKCGEEPSFVDHMEKWYCYECNTYVDGDCDHVDHETCAGPSEEPVAEAVASPENTETVVEHEDFKDYSDDCEEDSVDEAVKEEPGPAVEPKPEPAAQPAKAVEDDPSEPEVKEDRAIRMCSVCAQPLKWIESYQRHYCYGCKKYAPKDDTPKEEPKKAPATEVKHCPKCKDELKFIEKYSEWYCYRCKKYPLRRRNGSGDPKPEKKADAAANGVKPCPECGKPLKFVEKYQRHYCHACKAYAPKESKTCPACGDAMKFVQQYNEWYCYRCKKYSLRPSKPMLLL